MQESVVVAKLGAAFTRNCLLKCTELVDSLSACKSVKLQDESGEDGGVESLSLELPTDPPDGVLPPLRLVCCSNLSTEKDNGITDGWA